MKSRPPGSVTRETKSTIAALEAVSFHEGRGPVGADVIGPPQSAPAACERGKLIRRERLPRSGRLRLGPVPAVYVLGKPAFSFSSILPTVKLDDSCRGGNSCSVAAICITNACAGTTRKAWSMSQSQ